MQDGVRAVSCLPVSERPPTASARLAIEACVLFLSVGQDGLHMLGPHPLSVICSENLFTH